MKEIDKVYEYEMDLMIIVEDTERTRYVLKYLSPGSKKFVKNYNFEI